MKLQPDDRPRSSLGIGSGSDDEVGPHQKFAWRFVEGITKLTGNMPRDCRKKTRRLTTARMSEATGLVGILTEPPMSDGSNDATQDFGRLSATEPSLLRNLGTFDG
ncbi:hypothetical protein BHE74_00005285 [Ensete ventricosum]|nr:hypothetical protein BHE74_00005285 [Ensete ventricosum]